MVGTVCPKIYVATFLQNLELMQIIILPHRVNRIKIKPGILQSARAGHDTKKKKVNFGYLQSTAELIRCYCLPLRKLHVLNICRKKERSGVFQ